MKHLVSRLNNSISWQIACHELVFLELRYDQADYHTLQGHSPGHAPYACEGDHCPTRCSKPAANPAAAFPPPTTQILPVF